MPFLLASRLCEKFHKVDSCIVEDCDDLSSPVSSFLKESEKVLVESGLIQDWLVEAWAHSLVLFSSCEQSFNTQPTARN